MSKKKEIPIEIGSTVGIKLPYLKHRYADCFPQVAKVHRIAPNGFLILKDELGGFSCIKHTELDVLIKNN